MWVHVCGGAAGEEQRRTKAKAMAELKDLSQAARQIAAAHTAAPASALPDAVFRTQGPVPTVMRMKGAGSGAGAGVKGGEVAGMHAGGTGGYQWRFFHHNVSLSVCLSCL